MEVVKERSCPYCEEPINEEDKFCAKCDSFLGTSATEEEIIAKLKSETASSKASVSEIAGIVLAIIGFVRAFSNPIAGLILCLIAKKIVTDYKAMRLAKAGKTISLINIISVSAFFLILFTVLFFVLSPYLPLGDLFVFSPPEGFIF